MRVLEIDPEPAAVRRARAWVRSELDRLGRDDLVDAAQLGVSELVTNAILHARPPVVLRVAGTPAHPRVEVQDRSPAPPAVRDMTADERLLATVGRGIALVAMSSASWGAELSAEGKVVWFEPSGRDDGRGGGVGRGGVFVSSEPVDPSDAGPEDDVEPEQLLTVRLLNMPVQLFASFRTWYEELRRELRLLALSHGDEYPLATELSELSLQVARERRQAHGVQRLDDAIASSRDSVDLEYLVPASAPATMDRARELLAAVDRFIAEHQMLTLDAPPEQRALREWYFTEFVRQGRGEDPLPWSSRA